MMANWGGTPGSPLAKRAKRAKRHTISQRAWRVLRMRVLHRDNFRCQNIDCGKAGRLEVDHIIPLSQGGREHTDNLQTLCRDCHIRKTARENSRPLTAAEKRWSRLVDHLVETETASNRYLRKVD